VLAECWVPQRLKLLQNSLLNHAINDSWHSPVRLHSSPISL
jgi:hypothetical protein